MDTLKNFANNLTGRNENNNVRIVPVDDKEKSKNPLSR